MSTQLPRTEIDDARIAHFEKEENFRGLSSLLGSTSSVTLDQSHRVLESVEESINAFGEFAEIAHGSIDPEWILQPANRKLLGAAGFPLQDYHILAGEIDEQIEPIELVGKFNGTRGDLQGYCALRLQPRTSANEGAEPNGSGLFRPQIILAFSGTSNARLALYDVMAAPSTYKTASSHPSKSTWSVHDGFQRVYQGIKVQACSALAEAVQKMESGHKELCSDGWDLVITAHSLGAAVSYLFLLDLIHMINPIGSSSGDEVSLDRDVPMVPESSNITLALFGSPRVGNPALVAHFHELVEAFREQRGRPEALTEWSIIGHMDGVPALPPTFFGYAHLNKDPLYSFGGHLYRIPSSESEHTNFKVDVPPDTIILYPRGGHNYYGSRDMERLQRRMKFITAHILSTSKSKSKSSTKSKSGSGSAVENKSESGSGSGSGSHPTYVTASSSMPTSDPTPTDEALSSKWKIPLITSFRSRRSGSQSKSGFAEAETYPSPTLSDPQKVLRRNSMKRASWSVSDPSSILPSRSNSRFSAKSKQKSIVRSNSLTNGNGSIPEDKSILSSDHQTASPEAQASSSKFRRIFASPTEEMVFTNEPPEKDSPTTMATATASEWIQKYLQREEEEEKIWQKKLNSPRRWTGLRKIVSFGSPKPAS